MERFSDFAFDDWIDKYTVTAWDELYDEVVSLDVSYFDLLHFTKDYYDMTRSEAIDHLSRCEEHETEKLLTEYFRSKFK